MTYLHFQSGWTEVLGKGELSEKQDLPAAMAAWRPDANSSILTHGANRALSAPLLALWFLFARRAKPLA